VAAGARPALDHERLAEPFRQPLPEQPPQDVGRAAGWEAGDDAHRAARPGVGAGGARCERSRGSRGGEAQKAAARKRRCHRFGVPSALPWRTFGIAAEIVATLSLSSNYRACRYGGRVLAPTSSFWRTQGVNPSVIRPALTACRTAVCRSDF